MEHDQGVKAAIVVACRDAAAREVLEQELRKRYGADYHIVVCDHPAELETRVKELNLGLTMAQPTQIVRLVDAPPRPPAAQPAGTLSSVEEAREAMKRQTDRHYAKRGTTAAAGP